MSDIKKMQRGMNLILIVGMMISVVLVTLGGSLFLLHYGSENIQNEFIYVVNEGTSAAKIWESALHFSPLGMIELGLLVLIATQAIRVALLAWFYGKTRDYWFAGMSLFILAVLLYSFFFRE